MGEDAGQEDRSWRWWWGGYGIMTGLRLGFHIETRAHRQRFDLLGDAIKRLAPKTVRGVWRAWWQTGRLSLTENGVWNRKHRPLWASLWRGTLRLLLFMLLLASVLQSNLVSVFPDSAEEQFMLSLLRYAPENWTTLAHSDNRYRASNRSDTPSILPQSVAYPIDCWLSDPKIVGGV